jgi:hypothetical protein
VAVASGPATRVTPVGAPVTAVLRNPDRVVAVVPSKTLSPFGNTSMYSLTAAPSVRVKRGA